VDKKTINVSVLSLIIGALMMLGGVKITDDDVYYCEDRNIVMRCDSLSKYYSLDNGKCNNEGVGNKVCRTGWLEIVNEESLEPEWNITVNANGKEWLCESNSDYSKCVSGEFTGYYGELYNSIT
jgi:hypothetical protein